MEWIKNHRTFLLIEGIIFILMGGMAIVLPIASTFSIELFIGFLLLFSGCVQLYRALTLRHTPAFLTSLFMGILAITCGVLLLLYPVAGMLSLTLILTIFFLLEGVTKIALGLKFRPSHYWGWLIFNGIVSLLLAYIIWSGWPGTAFWVLGVLVGVNMIFFGVTLMSLSIGVSRDKPNV